MIGRTLWERHLHQRGYASAVAVDAGRIVAHERHTRLVCLSRHDGSLLWDVPMGTWPRAVVMAGDRCLVLPQDTGTLSCLDLGTGAVVWQARLRSFSGHVVVDRGTVVVGGWRGYTPMRAFDLENGRPLWQTPRRMHTVPPLAWGDGLLLGSESETWLVDPRDGRERLRWRLPGPIPDADHVPAFTPIDPGRCLVRCGAGSIVGLRLSQEAAEPFYRDDDSLLAVEYTGGVVWLRERGGRALAVDPEDGSPLWAVRTGQRLVAELVRDGEGFVVAGDGGLLFRLGRDGRVMERAWSSTTRVDGLRDLGEGRMLMVTKGTLRMVDLGSS